MNEERRYVIEKVKEAINILKKDSFFYKLIPEVRTNLVMCIEDAKSVKDVVGIPGRITHVFGKVVPVGDPSYGGSWHMARLLLAIRKYFPEIRAAINLKYDKKIIELARELGYTVSFFDRKKEPKEVKEIEGKTMEWAAGEIFKNAKGRVPQIVYDLGDWGKEPGIVIFGKDAVEVVRRTLKLIHEAVKRGIL